MFPLELSQLATSLSNHMGGNYEEAQEKVLDEYTELSKSGTSKKTIMHALQKNLHIPIDKKKKGKKVEFDF